MSARIELDGLHASVPIGGVRVNAVDGVSFAIEAGAAVALVGESGSGKTLTALAIPGLLPRDAWYRGECRYEGRNLLAVSEPELDKLRGREIAWVPQDAQSALDPIARVGDQVAEALLVHQRTTRVAARRRAVELLERVRVPDPERAARAFPHELSGGMRQRALLAAAIACDPKVLVLDEPTSALDATSTAVVLDVVADLRARVGTAVLIVTHDLSLVGRHADEVAVMYAGRIVEHGKAADVLARPRHPYTDALLRSLPARARAGQPLSVLEGAPPGLGARPAGCAFHTRCPLRRARCAESEPELFAIDATRASRCFFHDEVGRR